MKSYDDAGLFITKEVFTMVKVIFIGETKSGKTAAINRLLGRGGHSPYKPTVGVDVHTITNQHGTTVELWDCAGSGSGLGEGYYIGADICVIFSTDPAIWASLAKKIMPEIVVYVYTKMPDLRRFLDSIEINASPAGYVTNEEVTIINVMA